MGKKLNIKKWVLIGLFSLIIVAIYGSLMRYKIAFNFPYLKQKYLLHAHSHFAFSGWVTHFLYVGLAFILQSSSDYIKMFKYKLLIILNLVASYGMLISFTIMGYEKLSIAFSTMTIVVTLFYTIAFLMDSKKINDHTGSKPWAIMGLFMSLLSSLGPFYMASMIVKSSFNLNVYLGSLYYYLHFQYNGWFFFGSMALVAYMLPKEYGIRVNKYFGIFAVTVIPTVFLSMLWADLPKWLYILTVLATFVEFTAWFSLIREALKIRLGSRLTRPKWVYYLFYIAGFALSVKFILQAVSVIPSLSHLVFGIRSIVIAYLHLILLAVYSVFILATSYYMGFLRTTQFAFIATAGFIVGVILNESFLAIHGFSAFIYKIVPWMNELLFVAAMILLISSILLFISQLGSQKSSNTPV